MKIYLIRFLRFIGAIYIFQLINAGLRKTAAFTHYVQFVLEWSALPIPDWFEHDLDKYYLWKKTRNPCSWERGIFNLLVMKEGAKVLELCCGDGFNTHHFYSIRAAHVTALDINSQAINLAKKNSDARNVDFRIADIRTDIPQEEYQNIIWDASLEYFSAEEIKLIMTTIKSRLSDSGILSGFSIVQSSLKEYHKHAFTSKEDLLSFLKPYFKEVHLIETKYPTRHNLYFFASDTKLPEIII